MGYPTYLVHFNPNHDPKTGQFTFSKYVDSSGNLTEYSKKHLGLDKLNPNNKDFNQRKAKKALQKEVYNINRRIPDARKWITSEFTEDDDQADARMKADIENANKNKSFVQDWKNEVKKYFEAHKSGDWIEVSDKSIEFLKNKYPEYSDLIDGYSPWEHFYKYDQKELNDYMNMVPHTKTYRYKIGFRGEWQEDTYTEDPISYVLNNDFYYEPKTYPVSDANVNSLIKAINKELTGYFVDKYGDENVPDSWKQ